MNLEELAKEVAHDLSIKALLDMPAELDKSLAAAIVLTALQKAESVLVAKVMAVASDHVEYGHTISTREFPKAYIDGIYREAIEMQKELHRLFPAYKKEAV